MIILKTVFIVINKQLLLQNSYMYKRLNKRWAKKHFLVLVIYRVFIFLGVCDGFGKPQFVTYDRRNFTFNGNCTYIASRDKSSDGKHAFQVYVTNGECPNNPDAICTVALHIVFENHTLHIQKTGDEVCFLPLHKIISIYFVNT